jgi:hypothetical protein
MSTIRTLQCAASVVRHQTTKGSRHSPRTARTFGSDDQVLVERIGMDLDLHPFAAPGDDREHGAARRDDPHIVLQLRHVFLSCGFFRE